MPENLKKRIESLCLSHEGGLLLPGVRISRRGLKASTQYTLSIASQLEIGNLKKRIERHVCERCAFRRLREEMESQEED